MAATRKYLKTAEMAFSAFFSDGPLVLLDYLMRLLRVMILLALWRLVLDSRGAGATDDPGLSLGALLTYTLIAQVFAPQLDVTTRIEDAMWEGTLTGRFLQPMGLVANFTSELLGTWAMVFLTFSAPLLLLAPALGVDPRPASPLHGLLFVASLALAATLGVAVDFIFCGIAGAIGQNIWLIKYVRTGLMTILSGVLLPLQFLPWGLGDVFAWLPFASMASAPLRVYTGTGDAAWLIPLQAAWCVALWPVASWIWSANRERLAFHGG
ncbi:MAG TPA: ABC-2 family transporter protein [Chloroflexota bacterium]|nr:ABC-2 family transporter protein [Chloroflexota bacterium]